MTLRARHRALALTGLLVVLLSGCSGPRAGSSVSSAVSGCAAVLPLARTEVPPGSTLVSVHALSRGDAARYLREVGAPLPSAAAPADPQASGDPQAPSDPLPGSRRSPQASATQPSVTAPPATGPAATEPAATGPAATGPAATGPAATGPATGQPPPPGSSSPGPQAPRGCVVAYRGPFRDGLPHAAPGTTGEYALVFVDVRHVHVRAVVLVGRLPAGLRS